ncbi:MAG: hypothetical protein V1899_07980 [Planctomycetota bacterium]
MKINNPQSTINNLKSKIQNPQSKINNLKSKIQNPQSTINNLKSKIQNPQSKINNLKSKIQNPQSTINNLKSKIQNPQSTINNLKSKIQNLFLLAVLLCGAGPAAERHPSVIKLSNGEEIKGDAWFTDGRIRVYEGEDVRGGRYLDVTQSELVSIIFSLKDQSMERPWRFKNAGSDEKEFLLGKYPLINLKSKVKLVSGKALVGHLMTPPLFVRVKTPDGLDYEDRKFILKYQYKGEVGQEYKDIVYVTSFVFIAAATTAMENGAISGALKNVGKLEQVAAVGCERMQSYRGKIDVKKNAYYFTDLPKDTYDLAVLTDRGIFVGLSDASLPMKGALRPLQPDDGMLIAKEVVKFRDFFDAQEVLAVKGHRDGAKVLVHQLRVAPVHDQQALGTKQQRRLDVWYWHIRATEWHINDHGRVQLFRYQDEVEGFKRGIQLVDELAGIRLDPAVKKNLEVNYDKPDVTQDAPAPTETKTEAEEKAKEML